MKSKVVDVTCKCGQVLFKYRKSGSGALIKCFTSNVLSSSIDVDNIHLLEKAHCPFCKKEIGYWNRINGKIALKLNNGTVKKIKIG
ncbi:MAG: hypothetical protein B6226_05620 [Candidatus Cloacimonetes bacterium 4572_65]|nr:MAG: hypothetical protein B6226_05620 [Candidatus Cloacimonetes bacterium 4572_65]